MMLYSKPDIDMEQLKKNLLNSKPFDFSEVDFGQGTLRKNKVALMIKISFNPSGMGSAITSVIKSDDEVSEYFEKAIYDIFIKTTQSKWLKWKKKKQEANREIFRNIARNFMTQFETIIWDIEKDTNVYLFSNYEVIPRNS